MLQGYLVKLCKTDHLGMTQATIVAGLEAATGIVGGFDRQALFPW